MLKLWKARKPLPHLRFRAEIQVNICDSAIRKNVERGKTYYTRFRGGRHVVNNPEKLLCAKE